jgi:(2R)-3-sulfolactate dehydrogenase (NADP+)
LAFAAPRAGGPPLLIDQASSETAFVNVRQAAKAGRAIPQGWALDADGNPTTDAKAAVKGALLAFGGARGANIALMVEVLAAGLTGANWSLDAPSFVSGSQSPGSGLLVIAMEPKLLDPNFEHRLGSQLDRLDAAYGVHIPGAGKGASRQAAQRAGLEIANAILARLRG